MCLEVILEEEVKTLLLFVSLPSSYDYLVTTILYEKETLKIEEVKATLLSNEIMERPNLEEDTSARLIAKERGRS